MAVKTFWGSVFTTVFIGVLESLFEKGQVFISNMLLSAIVGAAIIAVAGGLLLFVDSSSGGTDIIALIIKKYSNISIGKALLLTDILIVIIGGILSGWDIAACSFIGIFVKTLGTDVVIGRIKHFIK